MIWPAFGIVVIGPRMPLRLVDARAVVGLDAFQVQLHEADRRDLSAPDRALDAGDRRLFQMEPGSCPLGQSGCCEREDESQ